MLEHLSIRNLVLIDHLEIDFSEGFTVISGETGAGKSIIIGALNLLLGEKAEASIIRTGCDEAMVSASFAIPAGHPVESWLAEHTIEIEDDALLINRTVRSSGRGTITVQSVPMTRSDLKGLGDALVDMHGQHEHQSLLSADRQRTMLDAYGKLGVEIGPFQEDYKQWQTLQNELQQCKNQAAQAQREEDYLSFALEELERANLKADEDTQIQEQLSVLSHFEAIHEQLSSTRDYLDGSGTLSVSGSLANAVGACKKAVRLDPSLEQTVQRMESVWIELKDLDDEIRQKLDSMTFSEAKLDELQSRMALIQRMKKKYGPTLQDVFSFKDETAERLRMARDGNDRIIDLEQQVKKKELKILKQAESLSEHRKAVAHTMENEIATRLRLLGMPNVRFSIAVEPKPISLHGSDHVEFLFSANTGVPLGNLRQIASGGELSRVMLAIKTVLAEADDISTVIFDEVDAGIGGSVAIAVGEQLKELSSTRQVLTITHLASIAAKADRQLTVIKEVESGKTYTRIRQLDRNGRIRELARMLSGDSMDDIALEHAEHLLNESTRQN